MITFYIIHHQKTGISVNVKAGNNLIKSYNSLAEAQICYDEVSRHLPCGVVFDSKYHNNSAHTYFPSRKELLEIREFREKYPNCRLTT